MSADDKNLGAGIRISLFRAELQQRIRRRMPPKGSKKIDAFTARGLIASAIIEEFGKSAFAGEKVPIIEFFEGEFSEKALEIVQGHQRASSIDAMLDALKMGLEWTEVQFILNHCRSRDKKFNKDQAEQLRSAVSLFSRDKEDMPSAHILETQMSLAVTRAIMQLFRLRRFPQVNAVTEFGVIQIAAIIHLAESKRI